MGINQMGMGINQMGMGLNQMGMGISQMGMPARVPEGIWVLTRWVCRPVCRMGFGY
jgi:hypothetical protein